MSTRDWIKVPGRSRTKYGESKSPVGAESASASRVGFIEYLPRRRKSSADRSQYVSGNHYYVILNPVSGQRQGVKLYNDIVQPMLQSSGNTHDLKLTDFQGQAEELAKHAITGAYAGVIIISGDGTVHEAVNGMLQSQDEDVRSGKVPILPLPGGSSNSIASSLVYNRYNLRCPRNMTKILMKCLLRDMRTIPTMCEVTGDLADAARRPSFTGTGRPMDFTRRVRSMDSGLDSSSIRSEGEAIDGILRSGDEAESLTSHTETNEMATQTPTTASETSVSSSNKRYTYLITCTGIMANVSATAQKYRTLHPTVRGVFSAVTKLVQHRSLGYTRLEYEDIDEVTGAPITRVTEGQFMAVCCAMGPNVSKEISLVPDAKIGDGTLHIFILRKKSRLKTVVSFLKAMGGTHLHNRPVNRDDGRQRVVVIKTKRASISTMANESQRRRHSLKYANEFSKQVSNSSDGSNDSMLSAKQVNLCIDGEIKKVSPDHTFSVGVSSRYIPFFG